MAPLFAAVFFCALIFTVQWFVEGRAANGFTTKGATLAAIYSMSAFAGLFAMGVFEVFILQPLLALVVFLRARPTKTDRDRLRLGKLQARQANKLEKDEASQRKMQESIQDFLASAERVSTRHGLNVLESSLLAYEFLNIVQEKAEAKS